jgi:glycosyltransferase involved in cell wall biosynthesis
MHLKAQTYTNIEIIAVESKGFPAEKRNFGFSKCRGEYVLFLDEDEYLTPTVIENAVKEFEAGCDIVAMKVAKANAKGYVERCVSITRIMDVKPLFFRRKVLDTVGLFNPAFVLNDDGELLLRALNAGFKQSFLNPSEGYIYHDETNNIFSVFRKVVLSRKSWKLQMKLHEKVRLDSEAATISNRRRIFASIKKEPMLAFGTAFVMLACFVLRRIP